VHLIWKFRSSTAAHHETQNTILLIVLIVLTGASAAGIGIKMQGSAVTMKAAAKAEEHWHSAHCLRDRYTGEWYGCH
jgi:hypothetical protein